MAGTRKPRREAGDSSGARGESRLAHCRTTYKIGPLKSVAQADSAQERPQREAGAASGRGRAGYGRRSGATEHSTSEPAAKKWQKRGRLYRWPARARAASGTGHLTRFRPQDSASDADPRRGSRASRWAAQQSPAGGGNSSGAKVGRGYRSEVWPIVGPPVNLGLQISLASGFCTRKAPARSRGQLLYDNRRETDLE